MPADHRRPVHSAALALLTAACASASTAPGPTGTGASAPRPSPAEIVAAPDRLETDRAIDGGRRPADFLAFLDLRPGMRVADLGAGGGYTTELLARAVGPTGRVYGQNSKAVLGFAGEAWARRLARPVNAGVVRVDREFESPLPPEAPGLDRVVLYAVYHDLFAMKVDRAAMNRAVFAALRPGGAYVVVDSSARAGTGAADASTLHRIDEALVRTEVEAAGFRMDGSGEFLRNPEDTRDWSSAPRASGERRGTSDRFVLRFVKP
jgi:predicted methyltransferase